jgi:hypothetical protein
MKKLAILFVISLFAQFSLSVAVEISDDGHTTVLSAEANAQTPLESFTEDVVPLALTPDYTCDLRMQVGGLNFGDFDNDNDPDLAVVCYHSQSYPPYDDWRNFLLINNNGQLETSPTWYSTDMRSSTDARWADFNGDGYLDLFVTNGDFSFDASVIYYGSASGLGNNPGWLSTTGSWALCSAPYDFDGDGDIDLAVGTQGASPVPYRPIYIYENNGFGLPVDPTWMTPDSMITNYVKWGDMDNDGWYDLACSKWANFSSGVYKNSNGVIGLSPYWTNNNTDSEKGIGWADVDGDGYPEVAIGGTNETDLYDNDAGMLGTFPVWQSSNSYHSCQDLAWGDIDDDGDPDLATVHFSNGHLRVYLNVNGVLDNVPSWQYDGPGSGTALAFGDINGDGFLDLVMGQSGTPSVAVFLNTMTSSSIENEQIPGNLSLNQNYPNPFNASTQIEFTISKRGNVSLTVYNLLGEKIDIVVESYLEAGTHAVNYNADHLSSGIYFYRLKSNGETLTHRMTLLK